MTTYWLIAAVAFLIGEIMTVSFFLLFIAFGCLAGALAAHYDFPLFEQALVCSVVSVLSLFTLRKTIQARLKRTEGVETDVGKEVKVDLPIPAGKQGRVTYQGTSWLADNIGNGDLAPGDRAAILSIDGNTLKLRKI